MNSNQEDWLSQFESEDWVPVFRPLLDTSDTDYWRVQRTQEALEALSGRKEGREPYRLSVKDGVTIIRVLGSDLSIGDTWRNSILSDIATFLEGFRHPHFLDAIAVQYPKCPDNQRVYLVHLLAYQEMPAAAVTLSGLIAKHGFPRVYPRVLSRLNKFPEHLPLYIVEFIRDPGRHIGDAVDLTNRSLREGHLSGDQLVELAPLIERRTTDLIDTVLAAQAAQRKNWRRDEAYFDLRIDLGSWLDLVGVVPACDPQVLQRALSAEDPLINLYLTKALLAKEQKVPERVLERVVGSYETLADLHRLLDAQGRLDLFPPEFATFEHFAAAQMVNWLLHPSELGEEPREIRLEQILEGQNEEGQSERWCLWRFTDDEGQSFAGVSGSHDSQGFEQPTPDSVRAQEVFSNFVEFDSATPEEHLNDVLVTLSHWRLALNE